MLENSQIYPEVSELYSELVELRRDFHMHPELLFDLPRTSQKVADYLLALGLEVHQNVGVSGVVGVINNEGPCILLRADMDALPVDEMNDVPYKSVYPGKSHSCGHDAHTAMLLVAAKVLSSKRSQLRGSVKFMFQPAEEGGYGAVKMIEDENYPVLEHEPKVDEVYALHVSGIHKVEQFCISQTMMGYADTFTVEITGKGGHMAADTNNPITIAAELVLAFQNIVSRNIDNAERAVLSITSILGGTVDNVVPAVCRVLGTIRSIKVNVREKMLTRITEICKGFELSFSCKINLNSRSGYPPIFCNSECIERMINSCKRIVPNCWIDSSVYLAGEDFSYLTNLRPGAYLAIGAQGGANQPNHSPKFDIDERSMLIGTSLLVDLVLNRLSS